jgi:hypothetical protein
LRDDRLDDFQRFLGHWIDFLGKILTGNHGFYHSIWGFPVNFPVNQSNDWGISVDIHDYDHPNRFFGMITADFFRFLADLSLLDEIAMVVMG